MDAGFRRSRDWPLLGAVAATLLAGGCWSDAQIVERTAPRREASLAAWREHEPAGAEAIAALRARTPVARAVEPIGAAAPAPGSAAPLPPRWAAIELGTGAAVPISADGYLLTAAHVVDSRSGIPIVVPRRADGTLNEAGARVARIVWPVGDAAVDLAILHVAMPLEPRSWAEDAALAPGTPVLIAGAGRKTSAVAAGRIATAPRAVIGPPAELGATVVRIRAPAVPGDSGGPAVLTDGRLIGIVLELTVGGLDGVTRSVEVWRLDPAFLEARIEEDRRRRAPAKQPSNDRARRSPVRLVPVTLASRLARSRG